MPKPSHSPWSNDAILDRAKHLWTVEGASALQIAMLLNDEFREPLGALGLVVTRNGVIGICHRKGWEQAGSAGRRQVRKGAKHPVERPAKVRRAHGQDHDPIAAFNEARLAPAPSAVPTAPRAHLHPGNIARKALRRSEEAVERGAKWNDPALKDERIAAAAEVAKALRMPGADVPPEERIYLTDLRSRTCKFAIGDDPEHRTANMSRQFFCGEPTDPGRAYCPGHHEIAHMRGHLRMGARERKALAYLAAKNETLARRQRPAAPPIDGFDPIELHEEAA